MPRTTTKPILPIFRRFLAYVNGDATRLPSGQVRDRLDRPVLRIAALSAAQWREALPAAQALCDTAVHGGSSTVEAAINSHGGAPVRIFSTPAGTGSMVAYAKDVASAPYALFMAMLFVPVSRRQMTCDRIARCTWQPCGRYFFQRQRRPARFCGVTCRHAEWSERRREKAKRRREA